jgi:general secretion pathway protein B
MSYILDALRKSDQQRKRGVPLLLAAQAPMSAPKRAPRLLYGMVALVLLGAGMVIGWLRPWQQEQAIPAARVVLSPAATTANAAAPAPPEVLPRTAREARPQELPPTGPAASPIAPAPEEAATIATAQQRAATQTSNKAAKQAPAQRADKKATPAPPAIEAAAVESQAVPQPATVQAPDQSAATAPRADAQAGAPAQTAVSINELPVSIQKDLPALSVMVHAYSDDPAKRMVGINNRLLHEGDEVAPGLKLERITLEGMILNYKGYSFRRGVR